MEKLTPERLAEIAQIVIPLGRFDRFMHNGREMNLADWKTCLEMAMYCQLDIGDWQSVISRLPSGLTSLEDAIACTQQLDQLVAKIGQPGGYFREFERQLNHCRNRDRLILRINAERFSERPMFYFYLQGERIARAVYGGGRITDQWALYSGGNTPEYLGLFRHIEYIEAALQDRHTAKMQTVTE